MRYTRISIIVFACLHLLPAQIKLAGNGGIEIECHLERAKLSVSNKKYLPTQAFCSFALQR